MKTWLNQGALTTTSRELKCTVKISSRKGWSKTENQEKKEKKHKETKLCPAWRKLYATIFQTGWLESDYIPCSCTLTKLFQGAAALNAHNQALVFILVNVGSLNDETEP